MFRRQRGPVRYSVMRKRCDRWPVIVGSLGAFLVFAFTWWWVINKAIGR